MTDPNKLFFGRLAVKDFRCFVGHQTLGFAVPNGKTGSGLTHLVGENNSGKTTLLEALQLDGSKPLQSSDIRSNDFALELYSAAGELIRRMIPMRDISHVLRDTVHPENRVGFQGSQSFAFIPSRRGWNPRVLNHREFSDLSMNYGTGTNTMRPSADQPPQSEFGDLLFMIEYEPGLYEETINLIQRVFPSFESFTTTNDGSEHITYRMHDGVEHRADFLGDGVVSVMRMAAEMVIGKDKMLVIDEPELSLHPESQRRLVQVLAERAAEQQILISTHSPIMVELGYIQNGASLCRVVKSGDNHSTIHAVSNQKALRFATNQRDWRKPQLFDVVAKELFFYDRVLFVEGQDDVALLRKCQLLDSEINVFGYGVGGHASFQAAFSLARELGITKAAALVDGGDKESEATQRLRQDFVDLGFEVFQWDRPDIRDKEGYCLLDADGLPDATHLTPPKKGYFDGHGSLKPEADLGDFHRKIDQINHYFRIEG